MYDATSSEASVELSVVVFFPSSFFPQAAVIQVLCEDEGIPFQRTVNKTGMPGGTTLGPIVSSNLPVKAVDMGMPVLAMHSACEMAHLSDYESMKRLLIAFWLK